VKYTIDEDPKHGDLSGKPVDLKVTVKEAREKQVPGLDDDLAKDTGEADTLDALKVKIRERLEEADKSRIRGELVQQAVKELIKRNEFAVASALVDRHARAMVQRAKRQLAQAGLDVEQMDDNRMLADFRDRAEEEARGNILIQAIAEREGISASEGDVQKRIAEIAAANNESVKKIRGDFEREGALPQLEAQIREQKTLDMLISQAKITDADPSAPEADEAAGEGEKKTAKAPKTKKAKETK
jgi:trigger factor